MHNERQHSRQERDRQSVGLRESKWWRSCWNGNQLDGDLLYRTIKAQQERRLASTTSDALEGSSSNTNTSHQSQQTSAMTNVAQLYATPRLTHTAHYNATSHRSQYRSSQDERNLVRRREMSCPAKAKSGRPEDELASSSSTILIEDDPLSDPLYASILGTSQQLKGITSQTKASRKSSATKSSSDLFSGCEFFPAAANSTGGPIYDNVAPPKLNNNNTEANLSDSSVDSASLQLKSLVERCLEVQRATQNNRSLLSISRHQQQAEQDHDHDQDQQRGKEALSTFELRQKTSEKFGALRQKQM